MYPDPSLHPKVDVAAVGKVESLNDDDDSASSLSAVQVLPDSVKVNPSPNLIRPEPYS